MKTLSRALGRHAQTPLVIAGFFLAWRVRERRAAAREERESGAASV